VVAGRQGWWEAVDPCVHAQIHPWMNRKVKSKSQSHVTMITKQNNMHSKFESEPAMILSGRPAWAAKAQLRRDFPGGLATYSRTSDNGQRSKIQLNENKGKINTAAIEDQYLNHR
jgi:hypothetical protein